MKRICSFFPIPWAGHFGFSPMFPHHPYSCTNRIPFHHFERPMADGDGPTWQHIKYGGCSCPCSNQHIRYSHLHRAFASMSFHHLRFCKCPFLLKDHVKHPALQHMQHQDLWDEYEYWQYGGSIQGPGVSMFYQHRLSGKHHHHRRSSHRGGHAHPSQHTQH